MVVRNSVEERRKLYPIIGINRYDVADWMVGTFDNLPSEDEIINNLTDKEMEAIASSMAEYLCETDAYNDAMSFALDVVKQNKRIVQ